ncbi:MAG: cobalamin-binding protein, partial [Firmicutes bacterium]|nr:cobalamin-binding protein [Bacillota bacterium]
INEKAPQVKTMIGGAPVSQQFADEIGAGGYAPDGAAAVDLAKRLLKD